MASIRVVLVIGLTLTAGLLSSCEKKSGQTQGTPAARAADTVWESGLTIALEDHQDPDPLKAALDKHSEQDHCRWQNLTSADRTVHLKSGWPFMEDSKDITVPAYGLSAWYSLDKAKASKDYPYDVSPSLFGTTPHGTASITVGD